MGAKGGPLESISIEGREFPCVGDSAGSYKAGGYENEVMVNGKPNTARVIMTPTKWALTDQPIAIDMDTDDFEFVEALKNAGRDDLIIIWKFVSGVAYKGQKGTIEGELTYDPMTASTSLSVAGPGAADKL